MGIGFGATDAYQVVNKAAGGAKLFPLLLKHRDTVLQTIARSSIAFGAFIGTYWAINQTLDRYYEKRNVEHVFMSAGVATLPFAMSRVVRRNLPWLGVIVGMDVFYTWKAENQDSAE